MFVVQALFLSGCTVASTSFKVVQSHRHPSGNSRSIATRKSISLKFLTDCMKFYIIWLIWLSHLLLTIMLNNFWDLKVLSYTSDHFMSLLVIWFMWINLATIISLDTLIIPFLIDIRLLKISIGVRISKEFSVRVRCWYWHIYT